MPQWPTLKQRNPLLPDAPAPENCSSEDELVIGNSLRFRGDLDVAANLRIEGVVKGSINASVFDVTIEKRGIAEANLHAGNVTVRGKVYGAIIAEGTVHLEPSAEVHGPIHAGRVVLDEGCLLTGRVDVSTGGDAPRPSPAETLISSRGGHRANPRLGYDRPSPTDH